MLILIMLLCMIYAVPCFVPDVVFSALFSRAAGDNKHRFINTRVHER
jgi:hypothetical protein